MLQWATVLQTHEYVCDAETDWCCSWFIGRKTAEAGVCPSPTTKVQILLWEYIFIQKRSMLSLTCSKIWWYLCFSVKVLKCYNYLCTLSTQILVYFSQISSKEQHNCEVKKENAQFTILVFLGFLQVKVAKKIACVCIQSPLRQQRKHFAVIAAAIFWTAVPFWWEKEKTKKRKGMKSSLCSKSSSLTHSASPLEAFQPQ